MALMMSLNEALFQSVPGAGILLGGTITALGSTRTALAVAGAGSLVVTGAAWFGLAQLRTVPTKSASPGATPSPDPDPTGGGAGPNGDDRPANGGDPPANRGDRPANGDDPPANRGDRPANGDDPPANRGDPPANGGGHRTPAPAPVGRHQ
jgi:hypothetical protein